MQVKINGCLLLLVCTAASPLPPIHLLAYSSRFLRRSHTMHCSIYLYRCSFHLPTNNFMRLVLLKEPHRNCLHCCQGFALKGCACTIKYSERLNLPFQNCCWTTGGIRKIQPYHSIHPHTVPWTRHTLPVVQMFCCCHSSFVPDLSNQ